MKKKVTDIVSDVKITIDEIALNDSGFESTQDNAEMDTIIKSKIPDALNFVYANADWSLLEPSAVVDSTDSGASISDCVGYYVLPDEYLRLVFAKFSSWKRYLGQEDVILWNDPEYATLSDTYATGTPERPKVALGWSGKKKRLELYCGSGSTDAVDFFHGYSDYLIGQGTFVPLEVDFRTLIKQGDGWYVYRKNTMPSTEVKICIIIYDDTTAQYTLTLTEPEEFTKDSTKGVSSDTFTIGYMLEPEIEDYSESDTDAAYDIPDRVYRSAIYYIAGLTLQTYRENGAAQNMFSEANDLMGFSQMVSQPQVAQPVAQVAQPTEQVQ